MNTQLHEYDNDAGIPGPSGKWSYRPGLGLATIAIGSCIALACFEPPEDPDDLEARGNFLTVPNAASLPAGVGVSNDGTIRDRCADGPRVRKDVPRSEVRFLADATSDELHRTLSGSAAWKVKAGFGSVNGAVQFASASASSKKTISIVYVARFETSRDVLDTTSLTMLVRPSARDFATRCGDSIAWEVAYGGLVAYSVVIKAETESVASSLRASLGLKAGRFSGMAELMTSLSREQGKFSVQILATQLGGDSSQISRIFGQGDTGAVWVRDCAQGDLIGACQEILREGLKYMQSTDRAVQIAQTPITLAMSTLPWVVVGQNAASYTSPEILIAQGKVEAIGEANMDCIRDAPEPFRRTCRTINKAILQALTLKCWDLVESPVNREAAEAACHAALAPEWRLSRGWVDPPADTSPPAFRLSSSFFPYDGAFRGGVAVATGDVDGDRVLDVVTGAGPGAGPHVRVLSGADGRELHSFMAYDAAFRGGVYVAAGDVNGDGRADIITGAGPGGGPHVRVFSGVDLRELWGFFAYDSRFQGGVMVGSADFDHDGHSDVVTGAGPGGGPHVRIFSGKTGEQLVTP
jgi:hypothetical protein